MSNRNPRVTVQRPFDMLVGNLSQGSTPAEDGLAGKTIQDVTIRSRYQGQYVAKTSTGTSDRAGYGGIPHTEELGASDPVGAAASFDVSDNDFSGGAQIRLADFTLNIPGDVTPGGGTGATATAIAAAIDNLPGFAATAAVDTVNVVGRKGVQGNSDILELQSFGPVDNFDALVPFNSGTPTLDGPRIS